MAERRTITVSIPFLPLFTLEQCWNCRTHMFPSRLAGIIAIRGRFCGGCRRDLERPITPADMGFYDQEHHHAE